MANVFRPEIDEAELKAHPERFVTTADGRTLPLSTITLSEGPKRKRQGDDGGDDVAEPCGKKPTMAMAEGAETKLEGDGAPGESGAKEGCNGKSSARELQTPAPEKEPPPVAPGKSSAKGEGLSSEGGVNGTSSTKQTTTTAPPDNETCTVRFDFYQTHRYRCGAGKHCGLRECCYDHRDGELAAVREPRNPYDGNAIAITVDDEVVGYVPADQARQLAKYMDSGTIELEDGQFSCGRHKCSFSVTSLNGKLPAAVSQTCQDADY